MGTQVTFSNLSPNERECLEAFGCFVRPIHRGDAIPIGHEVVVEDATAPRTMVVVAKQYDGRNFDFYIFADTTNVQRIEQAADSAAEGVSHGFHA